MKRTAFLAGALALVVVSLSLASYRAQRDSAPNTPPLPPSPEGAGLPPHSVPVPNDTTPPPRAAKRAKANALVEELVDILNGTKSKETFSVTLAVLQKLGKEARPAISAILRNADRLGLFEGGFSGDSKAKQAVTEVLEAIDAILERPTAPAPTVAPAAAS
jgi:hypothetical protein